MKANPRDVETMMKIPVLPKDDGKHCGKYWFWTL
jgi:hypothetical protein